MHFRKWFNEFYEDDQAEYLIRQFYQQGKIEFAKALDSLKRQKGSQAVIDYATEKAPDATAKILQTPPSQPPATDYINVGNQDVLRTPVGIPSRPL